MAKQRLNNIDPVRRSDIKKLFQVAPEEQHFSGVLQRDGSFTRPTEQEETILRWYRILTNDEAINAYALGNIPEPAVTDNNLKRRDVVPCAGGAALPEPAPSMWAIEVTRYNCKVAYQDRRDRYSLIRFPAIPDSGVNLTTIGNALKDERVLCWWNSNSGHWETESVGNTSTPQEPTPGADNVTFVSIDTTTGGTNQCDLQKRNDECLWPGYKVNVDSGGDFCSLTTPYSNGDPIWVVSIEGCIGLHRLELRDRHVAIKIADSLDIDGDIRELWGIRPPFDHPMEWIRVAESVADTWSTVDENCIYHGARRDGADDEKKWAKQLRDAEGQNTACNAAFDEIEFDDEIYCVEVNNRPFVKNRVYLGWKAYESYELDGEARKLFYFDAGEPPQQVVRYTGSATITVLNTTQLPISLANLGAIYGVARNAGNEITFAHPGRYRIDLYGEFFPGPGAHVQCRLILEQWNDALVAWQQKEEVPVMSWDSNLLNFWGTASITTIVDIDESDKLRMLVANPSAVRTVNVNRALLTIESWYEDAV